MKNNLKGKAPYFALGIAGYICIKFGLALFSQANSAPRPYENSMNGILAFTSNCLPTEGTLQNRANMMQLMGGKSNVFLLDAQEVEVINSDTFGKGSVIFWSAGPESFCQIIVKDSREDTVSLLLLSLERSGDGYEKVELPSGQLAGMTEPRSINHLFVAKSTNSVGQIMFGVTHKSTEDGPFTIFTAVQ